MSILGNRVLRKEDVGFLTEGACYTDDLDEDMQRQMTIMDYR